MIPNPTSPQSIDLRSNPPNLARGVPSPKSSCLIPSPQAHHAGSLTGGIESKGREGRSGTYRFVEGPRLQQRSVKRDAATPARRKMSVVTQNPMVVVGSGLGELLRRLLLLAPSRWIARSGRKTRQVLQGKEMVGVELLPATSRACFWIVIIRLRARDGLAKRY